MSNLNVNVSRNRVPCPGLGVSSLGPYTDLLTRPDSSVVVVGSWSCVVVVRRVAATGVPVRAAPAVSRERDAGPGRAQPGGSCS